MLTFIETKLFSKLLRENLSDDEFAQLQGRLIADPDVGDIIPGSGGVRKMRWGVAGRGKRGGLRIIYYWRSTQGQIWLLTLYAKNVTENIPAQVLRKIKEEVDGQDQAQHWFGDPRRHSPDQAGRVRPRHQRAVCIQYPRAHGAFAGEVRTAPWGFCTYSAGVGTGAPSAFWSRANPSTNRSQESSCAP